MKRSLLVTLLIAICYSVSAQVPGYIGRRYFVSLHTGPTVMLPFSLEDVAHTYKNLEEPVKIRPRLGLSLNFVSRRNAIMGLKYSYIGTRINAPLYIETNGWPEVVSMEYTDAKINCHSIDYTFQFFAKNKTNLPAPIGIFFGGEVGIGLGQFVDVDGTMPRSDNAKPKSGTYSVSVHPDLKFVHGVRRGMGKRLMFSVSMEYNLSYIGYAIGSAKWLDKHYNFDDNLESYQRMSNSYASRSAYYGANYINLSFELSFLP